MIPNIYKTFYRLRFFNGLDPQTKIYKYIPIEYVENMFREKEMLFSRVNDWAEAIYSCVNATNRDEISKKLIGSKYDLDSTVRIMSKIYNKK
jgi:hypothetical protein